MAEPTDVSFDLEKARRARDRVRALSQRHELILQSYWNKARSTFGQSGPDENEDHVTSSCTCILSFIDGPGELSATKLPDFLTSSRDTFVEWLLSAEWSSEDLGDPNVYTAPMALTALRLLDEGQLLSNKAERQVVFLVNELERSGAGVRFRSYPPSGFLTYWTVRALRDLVATYASTRWKDQRDESSRAEKLLETAIDWAKNEVWRQFSYFEMNDLDRFDPLQMTYGMAIVDLGREKRGLRPDEAIMAKGLEILFESQLANGLWAKIGPIFHYSGYGSVYPFAFETLTALMRIAFRDPRYSVELFGPHIDGMLRTLSWAEANETRVDGVTGWRSNVIPDGKPQVWATAMVLSFARSLDFLVGQLAREQVLTELDAEPFARLGADDATPENWTKLADSTTRVQQKDTSLRQLVFEHVVAPHFEDRDRNGRVWSAIFFGPPGTAKSSLATEIARFLGWPMVTVQTSDFLALGTDAMAHQARLIFRKLGFLSDTVVLIDEVEEFVRDREGSDVQPAQRLLTTAMLTLLQDLRRKQSVLLILATNHVESFDRAIRRPGRFDLILHVPPPSVGQKLLILMDALAAADLRLPDEIRPILAGSDAVERFTFDEWQLFVASCCKAVAQGASVDEIKRILDTYASALTITKVEWNEWKKQETEIYV